MRLALIACFALLPLAASAQELQPGKYRKTVTTDLAGMGARPMTEEDCITKKDIDEGLSRMGDEDEGCKASDFKRGPGTMSYRMACNADGEKSTGEVTATFTADTFDFKVVRQSPKFSKPVTLRIVGKRVGACK